MLLMHIVLLFNHICTELSEYLRYPSLEIYGILYLKDVTSSIIIFYFIFDQEIIS